MQVNGQFGVRLSTKQVLLPRLCCGKHSIA
jgi:hypothetical protein